MSLEETWDTARQRNNVSGGSAVRRETGGGGDVRSDGAESHWPVRKVVHTNQMQEASHEDTRLVLAFHQYGYLAAMCSFDPLNRLIHVLV